MSLDIIIEKVRDGFGRYIRVRQKMFPFYQPVYNNKDIRD